MPDGRPEPTAVNMANWYFFSDLHLFARRSRAADYRAELEAAVQAADTVVLGGDIFDFRWSNLGTLQDSIDAALTWLTELLALNHRCKFIYLLGNHDCNHQFVEQLTAWAENQPNWEWHHHHIRHGDTVFLHGDVVDVKTPDQINSYRRQWSTEEVSPKSAFRQSLYELVLQLRLHKCINWFFHSPRHVTRKVLEYLTEVGEGPDTGTRRVYFGHTHSPLIDYQLQGLSFFNGGAPLPGIRYRVFQVDLPSSSVIE